MKDSDRPAPRDAYLKALALLTGRDHSRGELARKLAARGFAEAEVAAALERLSSQGLLDDARFAAVWVAAALRSGRGFGARLLVELQQKGIPAELARQALAAAEAETTAEQVLADIVSRRFAGFTNETATPKERQRVYGYLQRRGFSLSTIISYFRNPHTE